MEGGTRFQCRPYGKTLSRRVASLDTRSFLTSATAGSGPLTSATAGSGRKRELGRMHKYMSLWRAINIHVHGWPLQLWVHPPTSLFQYRPYGETLSRRVASLDARSFLTSATAGSGPLTSTTAGSGRKTELGRMRKYIIILIIIFN